MYGSSPKLDAMDPGPIVSDAEITSSIKNTMNMLKTMSLPLSLLKGAASIDAFADAFKVKPPLHAFCTCISARITCRAFSIWPVKSLGCTLAYLVKTRRCTDCLVCCVTARGGWCLWFWPRCILEAAIELWSSGRLLHSARPAT